CRFNRVLAEDLDAAAGGEVLAGQQLHQGGLACSVAAEEAVDLVLFDGKTDVVHRVQGAEGLGEAGHLDYCRHVVPSFLIMSASCAWVMPSFAASVTSGRTYSVWNWSRRVARIVARAPSATNIPIPLCL